MLFRSHFRTPATGATPSLPALELFTVGETFGGWAKAQKAHFDDGGTFDRLGAPGR